MALTDQLEHYWTLNETSGDRADSYGSLSLTPTNTVGYATGTYSNGALFAAAGKLATASTPTAFNGSAYSVSLWWKFGASLGNDVILACYQTLPASGFLLYYVDLGGGIVNLRTSHALNGTGVMVSGNVTVGTGWHHIVATYDDTANTIALYHDGTVLYSDTITEGPGNQTAVFNVCRDQSVYGTADEIGIWSRALSAAEVAQLRATRTLDPSYAVVPGMKIEKIVEEDLNVGTGLVWVTNPGGGELRATQIGLHTFARGQKEYTATWSPGAITAGSKASTTVTVPDATVGDFVIASHDKMVTNDLRISGHVSAANTAKVIIHNPTSASVTPASGTVSVLVFPSIGASATPEVAPTEVVFAWLETSESAQVTFYFTLTEGMLGTDSQATVLWNWGDSSSNSYTVNGYDVGTYSKAHTYAIPPNATFTVTLTITSDLFNGYDSASVTTDYTNGTSGSSA